MTRLKFILSVAIVSLFVNATMAIGGAYIGSGDIIDGAVHANDIGKMAVTKTKIKTGAVNKYKIASGAVNQYKIEDGAVTPAKLSQSYARISDTYTEAEVDTLIVGIYLLLSDQMLDDYWYAQNERWDIEDNIFWFHNSYGPYRVTLSALEDKAKTARSQKILDVKELLDELKN